MDKKKLKIKLTDISKQKKPVLDIKTINRSTSGNTKNN
jgi:hypothetical protein